jgi:hypothetical protein
MHLRYQTTTAVAHLDPYLSQNSSLLNSNSSSNAGWTSHSSRLVHIRVYQTTADGDDAWLSQREFRCTKNRADFDYCLVPCATLSRALARHAHSVIVIHLCLLENLQGHIAATPDALVYQRLLNLNVMETMSSS